MAAEKELAAIVKELKELNRRLDRLCRASIMTLDDPVVIPGKERIIFDDGANEPTCDTD